MTRARRTLLLFSALLIGCDQASLDFESTQQALDICSEAVPANRQVDGIPAYAQCAAAQNSAIFSNNGVDTATASGGTGWVRTQYSGGYQCTEFAHRYLRFKWNITWTPNSNAGMWCDTAPPATSGIVQSTVPVHGDLIVFAPGVCGAAADTGHVAVVDVVDTAKSQVTLVEQNKANRRNSPFSCAKCFLHVVANTGAASDGGVPDTGLTMDARAASEMGRRRDAGTAPTGGSIATGGNVVATGGQPATGGTSTATATGGRGAAGGAPATGGGLAITGGSVGAGGDLATGGAPKSGGGDPIIVTQSSDGGCSFGHAGRGSHWPLFALLGILLVRRRRR